MWLTQNITATIEATDFSHDAKSQVVKLSFPEQLPAGSGKAVLTINFSGLLNNGVSGFPNYFCQDNHLVTVGCT